MAFAACLDTVEDFVLRLNSRPQTVVRIPRKEVIQAHLPVHLPCYDLVPVTNPTFDSSLPCGLGYRLQVLPAPMT